MATNPAVTARTMLVAEEPWKALLRSTLQAIAGTLRSPLPPQPPIRGVDPPLSGSNILRSERVQVSWHLWQTAIGVGADRY